MIETVQYRIFSRMALVGLGAVLLLCSFATAADEEIIEVKSPEEIRAAMSASGLLSEAGRLMKLGNYNAAAPFLVDYLDRMKDTKGRRVRALVQDVRFKLGKVNVAVGNDLEAQKYYEAYLEHKPLYRRLEVLKSLAVSCYESGNYERSIYAVTNAFGPTPVLEEEEKKVKIDDLKEEDLGGMTKRQLKRYEREEADADNEFFAEVSADRPEDEEYTLQERILLNMTLGESYAALEEWQLSVKPYQFVIEHAQKMERRGFAVMKLVTSLINLKEYDWVRSLVVELAKTEAQYDIRVNMAMMNAASALFNVAEYDNALMFYRMILSRQTLADYHLERANTLRREVGLPEMEIKISTNMSGRVESMLGYKYGQTSQQGGLDPAAGIEMPPGLVEIEESIGSLLSLQPYEDDVIYRTGQLYLECGRPWEALCSFDLTTARDPEGERGGQAFCSALQVMVDPLALYDRVEKRAIAFLDENSDGLAPRQVAYQLTAAYQRQEKFKEIKSIRPYLDGFSPVKNNELVEQYECELYYMQAIADLMLLNYKPAQDGFNYVLATFPGSHQEESVRYWHTTTHLFLQNYAEALAGFDEYLSRYPKGSWVASSWFQSGICQFGLEEYDDALKRFTYVIDNFRDSSVYPDACSLRGDIYASKGGDFLDAAVLDYREAIKTAQKTQQATYAVFQMATVFELESKFDEIIELVNSYLNRYGEEADVAKAAYWIGKTKLAQGLVDEAVDAYFETILKYGDNVRQDGVDLIISELMSVTRKLDKEERVELYNRLEAAENEAGNETLQLRLRVMLAEMDQTRIELGRTLISELDGLTNAPPPVLAVICDASFANKDYSRAEEMLKIFLDYFEDSEYMRAAYKLRAYDLFAQDKFNEAMKIVADAQGLYGVDDDTAWAQVMKGRISLRLGNLDLARETLRQILTIRAWRGEAYAEACYYLGELEEKAGDPKKAFAWYQRTYMLYKGLANGLWAAEGYLASARCLETLGRDGDMRNTYRAMLYDKYVNRLPQIQVAKNTLGAAEVQEIAEKMAAGMYTNLTVSIESEEAQ